MWRFILLFYVYSKFSIIKRFLNFHLDIVFLEVFTIYKYTELYLVEL